MARDRYYGEEVRLSDPANEAKPVTPNDDTDLDAGCRALWVGVGGDLVMQGLDDSQAQTWKNVPAGSIVPFRAKKIMSTGTTADSILALY